MKSVEITLGGQQYTIQEAPLRKNAAWRMKLSELVDSVTGLVGATQVDINNTTELIGVVNLVRDVLLQAPEKLTALLFEYSPALAGDRERIEADVYESELMGAMLEVLKLAFPFGDLLTWANGLAQTTNASTSKS